MATPAAARLSRPTTLAAEAQTCIYLFQRCLQKAALVHPRELSMVESQLARFSVWAGNMKVFGPSRQSLDHRLREAPDVRTTFLLQLVTLPLHIQTCTSWHSRLCFGPHPQNHLADRTPP